MISDGIYINQIEVGLMRNFSYLAGCPDTKECAVIDPAWEPDRLLKAAEADGMKIVLILLTHTHYDHLDGIDGIFRLGGEKKIYVHEAEAGNLTNFRDHVVKIKDGSDIRVGNLTLRCLHTPGHMPNCVCFHVGRHLFTGDTLFVNSVGRADFPESDQDSFNLSLKKLKEMADDTIVYPGHDYGPSATTTIGEQKKNNPYLMVDSFF